MRELLITLILFASLIGGLYFFFFILISVVWYFVKLAL